jgi:DNA polymerase-3 subunit chi
VTEISFRFNVPDRLAYACRYLRKAARAGRTAVAVAPAERLAQLDRALWRFDPTDFVPHVRLASGARPSPLHAATPVWLVERAADAPSRGLLLNLGDEAPAGFEDFERVVELVSTDPGDRSSARARWRQYQAQGHALESHDVGEETTG